MQEFKRVKEYVDVNGIELLEISEQENVSRMTGRQIKMLIREGILDFFKGERSSGKMMDAFNFLVDELGLDISRAYYLTNLFAYLYYWIDIQGFEENLQKRLIPISKIEKTKISSVEDIHDYFGLTGEETELVLDFKDCDTKELNSVNSLFKGFVKLEKLEILDLDMSTVSDMESMFSKCKNLKSLNVKDWDVRNVTNMKSMFSGCENLHKLELGKWNIDNATNIENMFLDCNKLNSDNLFNQDTIRSEATTFQPEQLLAKSQEYTSDNDIDFELWVSFFQKLFSEQMLVIERIMEGKDVYMKISSIAKQLHMMPEIMIEEINEIAEEYLGDLLIELDGTDLCIYEDYKTDLEIILGKAYKNGRV